MQITSGRTLSHVMTASSYTERSTDRQHPPVIQARHILTTSQQAPGAKPFRVLVVDSVAAPFSGVADDPTVHEYLAQRCQLFRKVGCRSAQQLVTE
jgi:hypothetical protein